MDVVNLIPQENIINHLECYILLIILIKCGHTPSLTVPVMSKVN